MNFSRVVIGLVLLTGLTAIHAVSDRIYNGESSIRGQFPYQVAITTYDGGDSQFFCGGSILNARWVLTAAHCIVPLPENLSHIKLRVGAVKWWRGHSYHVEKIIVHENNTHDKHGYDIALIKTRKPIKFSNFVKPIPINSSFVDAGHNVTLSGWGRINEDGESPIVLQFATLTSISNVDCQEYDEKHRITSNMLCTLNTNNITGCHGDSGGPLVMKGQLVGIVSFGTDSKDGVCESNFPNVFVRVSSFVDWIDKQMQEN